MPMKLRLMIPIAMLACPASPTFADTITDWNEKAVAFVTPRMVAPAAQRAVAIVQVAMFDAVNSIERAYRPYLVQLPAAPTTSKEAAAAAAAGRVLAGLAPQAQAEMKTAAGGLSRGDAGRATRKAAGHQARRGGGARILAARANDGADARRFLSAEDEARRLRSDAAHGRLHVAGREAVRPDQRRRNSGPQPPIPLAGEQWAADYNEIKDLGGTTSTKRSARQTEDARFWLITGPQSTDPIARQLVAAKKMSLVDSARFMALTAVAAGRRLYRGVRRQVSLRLLAPGHRHPQRRQRRQSRRPSATRPGSRSTTRRCIRNIPARIASAARPWPSWLKQCSVRPRFPRSS